MPTEEQLLEIHRLALLGGEAGIAQDVTGRLAGSWLGYSRFRDVAALCVKTLELDDDGRTLIYLGRAQHVLGYPEEALEYYRRALPIMEEGGTGRVRLPP